jgi:DNA helicase-2/ATP-dependent DNA helicase PcrA
VVAGPGGDDGGLGGSELSAEDAALVGSWGRQLHHQATLEREHRTGRHVRVPRSLSVTQLMRARTDPRGLADDLQRPMPRVTSAQAGLGTRFHEWVRERFELPAELDDVAGQSGVDEEPADQDTTDELAQLQAQFLEGPYASVQPLAVEVPYVLSLGGRELRGRIDAVYRDDVGPFRYQVVDWKTSARLSADPLQLGVYRLAWAMAHGCEPDEVDAVFYYVRGGAVRRPARLPGRDEILAMLSRLASSGLDGPAAR